MATATTTRVRLNTGRFGTVKNLFSGNGNGVQSTIQVGDKDVQTALREARKAAFQKKAVQGRVLMLEATVAIGQKDLASALKAMWKDRYACACYLTQEACKRERRFIPVAAGFHELELMEDFLTEKIREAGNEVPKKPANNRNNSNGRYK